MGTLLPRRARKREPITGVRGRAPAASRGTAPGQGGQRASPPEAERFLPFGQPMEAANLPYSLLCMLITQSTRGIDHMGVGGPDPLKICRMGQSMPRLP